MTSKNNNGNQTTGGSSANRMAPSFEERPEDGRGGRVVPMRLQKFLARAGVASRRSSENLMTAGRVCVNGEVVTELGFKVDPLVDVVSVDGREVALSDGPVTIMLNKPAGVITTMKAQSDKPIVADIIPSDCYPGLYPIGRLDADTTGLLLFSTDGELGNALLHPSHHVPKTYVARLTTLPKAKDLERLRTGIELDDGMTAPAEVEVVDRKRPKVRITIHEGRYHQVKRMFDAVGCPVIKLHRERFGSLELGNLKPGEWRELSPGELNQLMWCRMEQTS